MVNGGHLWIDNVYLTLRRKRLNSLPFAFVTAGALGAERTWPRIVRSTIFLSNMTFQGEHQQSSQGIVADITAAAVAVEGAHLPVYDCQDTSPDVSCQWAVPASIAVYRAEWC